MAASTGNTTTPEDYAILFSGGGSVKSNYTRYYDQLKKLYETLINQRGVDPNNIYVLYANGEESSSQPSRNMDDSEAEVVDFLRSYNVPESYIKDLKKWIGKLAEPILSSQQLDNLRGDISGIKAYFKEKQIPIQIDFSTYVSQAEEQLFGELDVFISSDLSFASQSNFYPASPDALREVLANTTSPSSLLNQIDNKDHLFFWTFDHGGVSTPSSLEKEQTYLKVDGEHPTLDELANRTEVWSDPALGNIANLTAWNGAKIENPDLADWIAPAIQASGFATLVYNQCFSGGMLEASRGQLASTDNHAYGMAAANAYETSKADSFPSQIELQLYNSNPTAGALFEFAKSNDEYAVQTPYPDNGGEREPGKEHPWAFGGTNGEFNVFSDGGSLHPLEQAGIDLIDDSLFDDSQESQQLDLRLPEDGALDLLAELIDYLGADIQIDAASLPDHGLIKTETSLIYAPVRDFFGEDSLIVRYSSSSQPAGTIQVNIEVEPVNDAPVAQDTFVTLDTGDRRAVFSVDSEVGYLGNFDMDGDKVSVKYFSAPENGRLKKTGKNSFQYRPDPGFKGDDSFAYVISDGEAFSTAEVQISVGAGSFSHDAFGFYQLESSDNDPIINPLRLGDGSVLTDDESSRWNIIAAERDGTVYRLLLEGLGRRDGMHMVWDAGLDGTVLKQRDWMTPNQLHNRGYNTLFDRDFIV